MKLGRLNHIGVATPSIEESVRYYREVMGATKFHKPFDLEAQGVKVDEIIDKVLGAVPQSPAGVAA